VSGACQQRITQSLRRSGGSRSRPMNTGSDHLCSVPRARRMQRRPHNSATPRRKPARIARQSSSSPPPPPPSGAGVGWSDVGSLDVFTARASSPVTGVWPCARSCHAAVMLLEAGSGVARCAPVWEPQPCIDMSPNRATATAASARRAPDARVAVRRSSMVTILGSRGSRSARPLPTVDAKAWSDVCWPTMIRTTRHRPRSEATGRARVRLSRVAGISCPRDGSLVRELYRCEQSGPRRAQRRPSRRPGKHGDRRQVLRSAEQSGSALRPQWCERHDQRVAMAARSRRGTPIVSSTTSAT